MTTKVTGTHLPNKDLFKDSYVSSLEQYKMIYDDSIKNNSVFWDKKAHELLHWQILWLLMH